MDSKSVPSDSSMKVEAFYDPDTRAGRDSDQLLRDHERHASKAVVTATKLQLKASNASRHP